MFNPDQPASFSKHPPWLKARIPSGPGYEKVKSLLEKYQLNTVCKYAGCPNIGECYGKGTATFLILGAVCTRHCLYCHINHGQPELPDSNEPANLAGVTGELQLKHVVITSVTRDDLPDGGAAHFARVTEEIRALDQGIRIELLVPDFQGSEESLKILTDSSPDIIGHNLETVRRLFPVIRPQGAYSRSLAFLKAVKTLAPHITVKSGIMIGMGENDEDIRITLEDLCKHEVEILTIGQYLMPTTVHFPLRKYYTPEEFARFKALALGMGFKAVAAAPMVRSSYQAGELFNGYTNHTNQLP